MPEHIRPRVHGQKTGFVWVRDFDLGMVTSLGGELIPGIEGSHYRVALPQLPPEERYVPIYMDTPEQPLVDFVVPRFVVRRDDFDPALIRWHPITEEYRVPAVTGFPVDVPDPRGPTGAVISGHTKYEHKIQAWPYDFTYTVEFWARYQNFVQPMMFHVMRTFPPYGKMFLVDSIGDTRSYDAFVEGGPASVGELLGMTDRTLAYAYTVRVTGEIDLEDEVVLRAAQRFNVGMQLKERAET